MRHSIVKREDRLAILMHDVNYMRRLVVKNEGDLSVDVNYMRHISLLLVYTYSYKLSTISDIFFVKSLQHLFDLICGTIEKI